MWLILWMWLGRENVEIRIFNDVRSLKNGKGVLDSMAFVNEKLSNAQRLEFISRGIKRPGSNKVAKPMYRTIDKERNMCLWHLGNMGRDDFNQHKFMFEWNGEEYFIIVQYSNPSVGNVLWNSSPYQMQVLCSQPCLCDFESALKVYAVNGRPDQKTDIDVKVELKYIL